MLLPVSANKKQFIDMTFAGILPHPYYLGGNLVVTGSDAVPVQISEEVTSTIIRQIIQVNAPEVLVVADDTYVFILLCHFVTNSDICGRVFMIYPFKGRSMINVNRSVHDSRHIMGNAYMV